MNRVALGLLVPAGLLTAALLAACWARPGARAAPPAVPPDSAPAAAAGDRWLPVARALDAGCRPCHFPGGEMYQRLPFDDPATVRAHAAAIAKRLEGADLEALTALVEAGG